MPRAATSGSDVRSTGVSAGSNGLPATGSWHSTTSICLTTSSSRMRASYAEEYGGGFGRWPRRTSGSTSRHAHPLPLALAAAEEMSDREMDESSLSACSDVSRLRSETSKPTLGYMRELPAEAVVARDTRIRRPGLGRRDRGAGRGRRARDRPYVPRGVRGQCAARWQSDGAQPVLHAVADCSLPRRVTSPARLPLRERRSRSSKGLRFRSGARTHTAVLRHGAPAGAAEAGGPRGARAGARDLRGARRTVCGRRRLGRAQADQRAAGRRTRS